MNNHRHPTNNAICGTPPGWSDPTGRLELRAIDVTRGSIPGNPYEVFISWWEPTPEEVGVLLRGGRIQLTCIGGQPAVNVSAVPSEVESILLPGGELQ